MFAHSSRTLFFPRLFLAVVILFNAVAPVAAHASSDAGSDLPSTSGVDPNTRQSLPEQKPSYFSPPQIPPTQERSPEPDEPISPVPPKDEVEFTLVADPAIVPANGLVTFKALVHNHTRQEIVDLTFTDMLDVGLEFSQDPQSPVAFDPKTDQVSLIIDSLAADEAFSFSYTLLVTSSKQDQTEGKIWLHNAELNSDKSELHLKTSAAFGVDLPVANADAEFAPMQLDGGWNELGRVAIHMEEENVGRNAVVVYSPTQIEGKGPEFQFDLDVYETDPLAADALGELTEQAISLKNEYTGVFQKPAFLEIDLNEVLDLKNIPAGQEPYVATYDEVHKIWVKIPILESDVEKNSVTVQAAHFSTWGAGLGSSLPQNGANVLLFDQPYTSLFTGSARYSIPVWTPPGRGGMQPDISLSYSSGTVDGVLGDVQAPWVGMGWNIDAVEIVRKITTDANGYGYRNEYALTLNGSLYQLVRSDDPLHLNRYYTDQAAFLYVELHNHVFGIPSTENAAGEWWEVVTTDGTRYRLGWADDSEQLALMYGYSCSTENCATPDGAYASLGYAGSAQNMVPMRWRVDRVSDLHGNYMDYHYHESQPSGSTTIAAFDRESYLEYIEYTGFEDPEDLENPLAPGYQVKFTYEARSTVGDIPTEFNIWDNVDSQLLKKIELFCLLCNTPSGTTPIRKYDFGYTLADAPNENGTLTLTSVKITGGGYTENGQLIPTTSAPTIRFSYENKPNRKTGNGDVFNYPRLVNIENGSGGKLTFTYGDDDRPNTSWLNYRVENVLVESGMGVAKKQSYTYGTPVYSGGSLTGYPTVTETLLDFNNSDNKISETKHTFGTVGLDIGRELQTESLDHAGTVLRKTTNAYVTDNSQAPFFGWNYRYLGETISYALSGSSLVQTSKTTYYNDPKTGNPLLQSTFLGNRLYRKTYYEYMVNTDPSVYILDKPYRVLLVDANNAIYSDTRYHYDYQRHKAPTRGVVTLVQKVIKQPDSSIRTVDIATDYNIYGNTTATRAYKDYGFVDVAPADATQFLETETTYDQDFQTYATTVTNAMDQSSASAFLHSLGVPYQMTDPNQWTTTTTYDGLGRTLSVTPPGLDQPGTVYIYPSPNAGGTLAAPHSVEMQILDTIAGKYRSVWGIYDGAGRMLQTQVDASIQPESDKLLVNTTLFNAQGLAVRQSLPYEVNASGGNYIFSSGNQFTTTEYDAMGRAVKVTSPGNIISEMSYEGLTTTSVDPNGNVVSRTTDGLGRMTAVAEFADGQTVYATTNYFYDPADRLILTKDAYLEDTTIQYDWLGRKTGMEDPDMGVWKYEYDSLGNMASQTDAKSQQLKFFYDDLNRLTRKDIDGNLNTVDITYTYGSTEGFIGLRTAMTDTSGSATWTYSDFGRTVTEARTIQGEQRSITTNTDWLGRPIDTTYSDGEAITYEYDALGRPDKLKSDGVTLVDLAYNVLGQISTQILGNGAVITNTYDFNAANNTGTTRLLERKAEKGSNVLLDVTYSYDSNGNILRLTDLALSGGETHFYQYDGLNRLTSAIAGTGALTTPPATPELYGQKFEYDKVGNMLKMSNWGASPTPINTPTLVSPTPTGPTPTLTPTPVSTQTPTNTQPASATATPQLYTYSSQPDATSGVDTTISGTYTTMNFGTNAEISVGEDASSTHTVRSLLKFDLSSIPSNATITSAALSLWTSTDSSSNTRTIRVYRLKAPFNESQATWNISATGTNWQTAGASGTNDRESTDIGSVQISATESIGVEKQITLTSSKIQEFVNGTFTNNGFIIVADTEVDDAFAYHASDSSTSSQRPKLVIQYTVPQGSAPNDNFYNVAYKIKTFGQLSGGVTDPRQADNPRQAPRLQSGFPSTSVLDNFDRSNGAIGSSWSGYTSAFSIASNQLDVTTGGWSTSIFWNATSYAADQEAYVTFTQLDTASGDEHSLILKSQNSSSTSSGLIFVMYDAAGQTVQVWTYHPSQDWVQYGSNISATFTTGDQLGARALANGTVEVYKNGTQIGTRDITAWPCYADGGYIGLWFASAPGALADNFGGGSVSTSPTSTPTHTPTYTSTATSTPTSAGQATATFTATSTSTITSTPTKTLVPTNTPPGTSTPSPTNTATPTIYTLTPTRTPTIAPTSTRTRTPSPTVTGSLTPTPHFGSLLAHWDFNAATGTTVPDAAIGDVTANNLTLQGATLVSEGANGSAAYFDGQDDSATVANQAEIKNDGSFTISAWINPASVETAQTQYIIRKGGVTNYDYGFTTTSNAGTATPTPPANVSANGNLVFTVSDLSPNKVVGPILPIDTWTLVTGVYDSENEQLRLYINGTLVGAESVTVTGGVGGEIEMGTGDLYFSRAGNVFNGKLDDVRFYKRALTDQEVSGLLQVFATPTPLPTNSSTPVSPATSTPTATAIPLSEQQWGTGDDGDLTVANGSTFNIHVNHHTGRTCADAISYSVTSLGSKVATLGSAPASDCLAVGDEVVLMNLRGSTTSTYNVGTYEFLRVASISDNVVEFTTYKSKWYGGGFHSDANIGTGSGQQRVVLQRVPNYEDVIVNGTLTANEWTGSKYGLLVFRVSGALSGSSSGLITVNALGYQGGQHNGEGLKGTVSGSTGGSEGCGYASCSGAGGGHAVAGNNGGGGALGGTSYGNQSLSTIFFGSAGGSGGWYEGSGGEDMYRGPDGGDGGGILYVIGYDINFPGTLSANGTNGSGAGAGGSIRVEGYTVTLGSLSAVRGTSDVAGSKGRVAIYYQSGTPTYSSNPAAYAAQLGQPPTTTPVPTSIDFSQANPYGTGKDGNLTVSSGSFNLNTQYRASRTCAEAIAYSVIELTSSWAKVSPTPADGCLAAGDEILLINLRGKDGSTANTGRYEFLRIGGVVQNTVYFTTPKVNYYGDDLSDENIGTSYLKVMLQRVPNYQDVTVNGTLTANAFDGYKYGVVAFRVAGTLTGSGTISVDGMGYRGGRQSGIHGEGIEGKVAGSTGGTAGTGYGCCSGGGGGYGASGSNGTDNAAGGTAYGEESLSLIYLGSGGGSGGEAAEIYRGDGGDGGGILYVIGYDIDFSGTLSAKGMDGVSNGGGGAGGSIRIEGYDVTVGTLSVAKGTQVVAGGRGRIAIYYANSLTNSSTLCAPTTTTFCQDVDLIVTLTPSATPTSTPFGNPGTTGLVAWWSLDQTSGTRTDVFGTNELTDNNTVGYAAGKIGNAADLESSQSEFLDRADNATLSTGDVDFTFAAWIKLESMPASGSSMVVAGKFDGSGTREWTLDVDGATGLAGFNLYNTGGSIGSVDATSFGSLTTNTWYYVVAWHDSASNTVKIQINNGTIDSAATTGSLEDTTADFRLGAQQVTEVKFFDGLIDEAAYYKRKLTTYERTWLYNNGTGRAYSELSAIPATPTPSPTLNPAQWYDSVYSYDTTQPHAVDSVNRGVTPVDSFLYDANGNMTCRTETGITYKQDYNAENRISAIHKMNGNCSTGTAAESWFYMYDGDGVRTSTAHSTQSNPTPVITRYYFGGALETTGSAVKKYYSFAGQTIAMKDSGGFRYFLSDHLGSTSAVLDTNGGILEQQRYLPFGAPRQVQSFAVISQTDLTYTGQRDLSGTGLMDYKARFYSPYINRFLQPDSIIPDQSNPQSWNRYSYVLNSPIAFNDPSGHGQTCGDQYEQCGGSYEPPSYCDTHPGACGGGNDEGNDSSGGNGGGGDEEDVSDDDLEENLKNVGGGKPLLETANTENFYCGNGPNDTYNFFDCMATFTQDLALLIDTPFAAAEYFLVALACFGGACGAGVAVADMVFTLSGANTMETVASVLSALFSLAADGADNGRLGESSVVSVAGAGLGFLSPDPLVDFAIDAFGASYNHDVKPISNLIPWIRSLINH